MPRKASELKHEIKLEKTDPYFQSIPHQKKIIDACLYFEPLVKYSFVYIKIKNK